jgi:hypothetical protein
MTAIGPKECPNDDGRAGTAMPAIVGHDGPEVAALGGLPARVQNRRAGLVHEDPVGAAQMSLHVVDDRHQVEARTPDPVAERTAVEVETLPLEDPRLAVKRQVVAELRDDNPRDQPPGRQSAGHDMLGRMRLNHGLRTTTTGVSGAPRHQHLELRRDHVEPSGYVLAYLRHLPTAARTQDARRLDHTFNPGQVRREMTEVACRLAGCLAARPGKRSLGLLLRSLKHTLRQFCILERQVELVGRQLLGAFAELLALRCAQDIFQPTIGLLHLGQRRFDLGKAGFQQGVFAGKSGGIHDPK